MAIPGETVMNGLQVASPWFTKGADNAYFLFELLDKTTNGTMTIYVVHKNAEDSGNGDALTSITLSSVGRTHVLATGLKELVRFGFDVGGSSASDWCNFRVLGSVWFDTGAA